jgi:hypothetical protein
MEYQRSETFHLWKALWDLTFSGFARGSLDTLGEIRGGLLGDVLIRALTLNFLGV